MKKLTRISSWKRIFLERLTEPVHLNIISLFVLMFGSYRLKTFFDIPIRQHNAFALLKVADFAKNNGIKEVAVVEFGVATGAGLLNLYELSEIVRVETGIKFRIIGLDTGKGMPPPLDYRDHPDIYKQGDFPMNFEALQKLPSNVELIIRGINETLPILLKSLSSSCPLGYVVLDLDYYSSAVDCLKIFLESNDKYLPNIYLFADDVTYLQHNQWQGELLAI